jgi:uncharacterized Zn finger protein
MPTPFVKALDRPSLLRLAGAQSFSRGEDYFESGLVHSFVEDGATIAATVRGTHSYRVKLTADGRHLDYECTCPMGDDGAFCKHCVAVGLTWLAERSSTRSPARPAKPRLTMDDVRAFLERQDKKVLVDLLAKRALEDDRLREQLLLKAARGNASGLDVAALKVAIDDAVAPGDYIDWREAHDYSTNVEEAVDTIAQVLKDGHAAEAIELSEHALAAVESAVGMVDDSDGHLGGILEGLQELHLAACRKAKPDPEALAERLFAWELKSGYSVFYGAVRTYAKVLGARGLAAYRRHAHEEWATVRALGPGETDPEKYGRRFHISHIMESLAEESGDVEAQVAVLVKDLSAPHNYLRIAEVCRKARQADKALEWAERGLEAFPSRADSRLREFLAGEYHRRQRHEEAMALIWAEYSERTGLATFKVLKEHSDRIDGWQTWRERAITFLREEIDRKKRASGKSSWYRPDHSPLVEIFLWEKRDDEAWREAQAGGCSNELWLQLAGRREADHPADASGVYRRQVEATLRHTGNDAYAEAVRLLRKIRQLEDRLGRKQDFAAFLASVREAHRRKRNFMALLSRQSWE